MTLQFPLACFVGLAVAGAEVGAAGYARQVAVLALCEDGATRANTASLQWQHAQQSWGLIDTVQIWSAATGGTLLGSVPAVPIEIRQYDSARIPAGGLAVIYGIVPRGFGRGLFGTFGFGSGRGFSAAAAVLVERLFDQQHACAPGTWAEQVCTPGTWPDQHVCAPGSWAPGPFSRAA